MTYYTYSIIIFISVFIGSCSPQEQKTIQTDKEDIVIEQSKMPQIGQYVTGTFEDSNGHLWFGTIQYGIARYDGKELLYYKEQNGLPSQRVTSVREDANGILWFNTDQGISKFDGQHFTNLLVKEDDFLSNIVSQFFIDSKGKIWVGTWGGVYQFDGSSFTPFPLPYPSVETSINEDTKNWITEIKEDAAGNMWFARDAYGVCKYDGHSFTHYLKKDGLLSNNVTELEIDDQGNIWLGMRNGEKDHPDSNNQTVRGGLNQLTNGTIRSFPDIAPFNEDDVYEIYNDRSGNIWISTTKSGVYKFDGKDFQKHDVPISIMSITDDSKGNLWLGGAGGLYKIDQEGTIRNVTINGPWE